MISEEYISEIQRIFSDEGKSPEATNPSFICSLEGYYTFMWVSYDGENQRATGVHLKVGETYFSKPKTAYCGYTGKLHEINWSGDEDCQPYAWKEII